MAAPVSDPVVFDTDVAVITNARKRITQLIHRLRSKRVHEQPIQSSRAKR